MVGHTLRFEFNDISYCYDTFRQYKYIGVDSYNVLESPKVTIKVTFIRPLKNSHKIYEKVINEWYEWGKNFDNIKSISSIELKENNAIFQVNIPKELEDTLACLVMMLEDTRKKTKIDELLFS